MPGRHELRDIGFGRPAEFLGEQAEGPQLVVVDVCMILIREEVLIKSVMTCLRQDDAAMHVPVEALLENASAEIVSLAKFDRANGLVQVLIRKPCFSGCFREPPGLGGTHAS